MAYRYRSRHSLYGLALTLLVLVILLVQNDWLNQTPIARDQPGLYRVSRFVDGDTIAVTMNGHQELVRFIGVDTPETHKPNTPVQCYGPAAAAYTKHLIGASRVRLVSDPQSTNRDRYNRLLRYIYLTDGTNVDKKIIENGYGFYYPYFPFSQSAQFALAQQSARTAKRGLWGNCQPTPTDKGGFVSNPA